MYMAVRDFLQWIMQIKSQYISIEWHTTMKQQIVKVIPYKQ